VFKVLVSENRPHLMLMPDPASGLLHEDLNDWDTQEALCQWYTIDLARFEAHRGRIRMKSGGGNLAAGARPRHPRLRDHVGDVAPAISQLILSSASPQMIGAVNTSSRPPLAIPRVSIPWSGWPSSGS